MPREQDPIATELVVEAVIAALDNAERLLADARVLVEHGSPPTALAVATLAIEEATKAVHFGIHATEAGDAATVLVPPTDHATRLLAARRVEGFIEVLAGLLVALVQDPHQVDLDSGLTEDALTEQQKHDNARKQRGFYVDVDESGLHTPMEIDEAEANRVIDRAALAVAAARTLLGSKYWSPEGPVV